MSVTVDSSESSKRSIFVVLGQVVLISVVAMIGWNIAMPGLDPAFMEAQSRNGLPSQLSILALGVGSILTAFALGQIVRLFVPRLENSVALVVVENILALVLAVSQASGIAQMVSTMGFLADASSFGVAVIVASLVGGVAVLLFLSRFVVLPSLVAGFWILWLLPALMTLPSQLSSSFEMLRVGAVGGSQFLLAIGIIAVAVGLVVFAIRAVLGNQDKKAATGSIRWMNVVVWPPLLAATASSYVLMPLAFLAPDSLPDAQWLRVYVFAVTAVLIPVFVFGYRRFFANRGVILPLTTMLILAAVQIVLVVGGAFATEQIMLPLPFSGTTLLVLVAVIYALIDALRAPSTH
ncbi:hypothetical protein ABUK73_15190 [Agrobacterium sp. BA1120]|uniref:hypothetical protein n=1 Tax=Agrobacterium sp. BA1120 TaxID=3228927 RepID=UPI00336A908B